jgi:hypothetical protein
MSLEGLSSNVPSTFFLLTSSFADNWAGTGWAGLTEQFTNKQTNNYDQHQRQQTTRANHAVYDPIFIQYIIMHDSTDCRHLSIRQVSVSNTFTVFEFIPTLISMDHKFPTPTAPVTYAYSFAQRMVFTRLFHRINHLPGYLQ